MADSIPGGFRNQMEAQLGRESEDFFRALSRPAPVSVRLHPLKKIQLEEISGGVKWYAGGKYLTHRPVFTLDPAFHAGAYYPQEASSMLIGTAIQQLMPSAPLLALDLAAAPGGKSTLLAELLPSGSLLVANEVIRTRYQQLRYNLLKWGYPQVITSNHDPRDFRELTGFFDLLLLDAPCSGEGLFRKTPEARAEWSLDQVRHCSLRQRRILEDALPLLKPGGILLYSTCTYNAEENQNQVDWMQGLGMALCPLRFKPEWGIADTGKGYQCYPHRLAGEGFFLAALRKGDGPSSPTYEAHGRYQRMERKEEGLLKAWLDERIEWAGYTGAKEQFYALPRACAAPAENVLARLRRSQPLLELGRRKGKQLIPAAGLALSLFASPAVEKVALSRRDALRFLKKELNHLPEPHLGWGLATYGGLGLGWFKGLPTRINNYYPTAWRIRMNLD